MTQHQKQTGKGLVKVFTLVLLSSLFLENFTVFILDFSLLSTLKDTQSLCYFITEASSSEKFAVNVQETDRWF